MSLFAFILFTQTNQSAFARSSESPPSPPTDSACVNDTSWIAPQKPVRIYGNTWHVGPRGLGIFLLTSPSGHVLIDGGVPANAAMIEANVRSLGFNPHDIKWILNTHAHCDHAGGIAQLARDTGAQVISSAADAHMLADGGRNDPHFGDRFLFPPVQVTRTVADGEQLQLGEWKLTAHLTAGHTMGNTSWTWTACEGLRCLQMAVVGSLSAPGYRLIGHPSQPDLVQIYERSFVKVAGLPCDIALAPHPDMVDFWERLAKRERGDADALIDPTRCRAYVNFARASFAKKLKVQRREVAKQKSL